VKNDLRQVAQINLSGACILYAFVAVVPLEFITRCLLLYLSQKRQFIDTFLPFSETSGRWKTKNGSLLTLFCRFSVF
jgi:hypothetical protein